MIGSNIVLYLQWICFVKFIFFLPIFPFFPFFGISVSKLCYANLLSLINLKLDFKLIKSAMPNFDQVKIEFNLIQNIDLKQIYLRGKINANHFNVLQVTA